MSDHADWPGLQQAISASGAERVFVTHGQVNVMVRWLQEQGLDAQAFVTEYGEDEEAIPSDVSDENRSMEAAQPA